MASRRGLTEEEMNVVLFFQDSDAQSEQSDVDDESDVESDYDIHQSDEFVDDESLSEGEGEAITIQLADEPEVWRQDQNRFSTSW